MKDNFIIHVLGRDGGLDDLLSQLLANEIIVNILGVLSRDNDGVDSLGNHGAILVFVLDSDLSLGIRAQPSALTVVTGLRETLNELAGEDVGEGHELLSLISSITKHVTLITSTNILLLATNVDTAGNLRRLLLDGNHDVAGLVIETLRRVVEANTLDGAADHLLVVHVGKCGDLTKDDDHAGLGAGF